MKAIILAGGKATRLPSAAKEIPKALVEVGGKPVLQHQIDLLQSHGISDIRLALGHKAEQIREYVRYRKPHIECVVEEEPLGTGGAIAYAARGIGEPFFVLNGDILSDIDFTAFARAFRASPHEHMLAVWYTDDARSFGLVVHKEGSVHAFHEKPAEKVAGHINAGAYLLSPHALEGRSGERFSIENDIFPHLIQKNTLGAFVHEGWWEEMGTEERLRDVRERF